MHQEPGDDSAFPISAGIPDDSDPNKAVVFNVAYEALLDRTAWLKTNLAIEVARLTDLLTNGFPTGWPKLKAGNAARDHEEWMPFPFSDLTTAPGVGTNWTNGYATPDQFGSVLGQATNFYAVFPIRKLRNNARLKKVTVYFTTNPAHTGVPVARPNVCVYRTSFGVAATAIGPVADPDPGLYATTVDWNSPSVPPFKIEFVPTATGGELITDAQAYFIQLQDERGANSLAGTRYWGAVLTWEITEVQP